ncbi:SDR family oxidoreductase [Streptomyces sp. NPDC002537]
MRDLTGKVALVTGGARNVGKVIATTLADRGAHVLINYFHSHEQAKRTQEELRARGARVDLLRASVAQPDQVTRMFAEIESRFGRLDILVNNAANGALVPVSELTDTHLDKALDTNLKGGLRCARAAAPLMARGGGGSIVTVSALGGSQMVMANYLACAPAKAAAEAVTRYLAVEFAPLNIRVNTASAAMLTSEVADAFPDAAAMQDAIVAGTPLGRLGTPEEFAEVVAFLASDRSSWITGQVLLADGGLTLGASLLSPRAGRTTESGTRTETAATDGAAVRTGSAAAASAVGVAARTEIAAAAAEPQRSATPTPAAAAGPEPVVPADLVRPAAADLAQTAPTSAPAAAAASAPSATDSVPQAAVTPASAVAAGAAPAAAGPELSAPTDLVPAAAAAPAPAAADPEPSAPESVPQAAAAPVPAAVADPAVVDSVQEWGDDEIAVVGMGLAVSGANSPEEFWQLRTTGRELFIEVPEDRWERASFSSPDRADEDKGYQDHCVFITDFQPERAALEGLVGTPDETELTTLWLRHSLVQALDGVRREPGDRFSFHVGYTADGSQHLEEAGVLAAAKHLTAEIAGELAMPEGSRERLLGSVDRALSGRYHRGHTATPRFLPHQVGRQAMRGVLPDETQFQMVDTACSSSLYAIDIGVKGLLMGKQDIAVCGGAFALAPRGTVLFSKLKGLSERGAVHALDAEADGVIFADGAGVVVLKRMSRAKADGDRVLGVLKAFGSSSDGKGKAIYAPSSTGQNLAVERALAAGGIGGNDIDWVNAHATGTPAGDLAEFTTLRQHYGVDRASTVTSNKSLIGHTGWAAGVVSLIESILGMQEQTIPGQYRFRSAPKVFELDSTKLEISSSARPWPATADGRRTAAISGFGFGGTNAHLILTEHTDRGPAAALPRGGARPAPADRIAVVGWSAKLPGADSRDEVLGWLAGDHRIDPGFGDKYPAPPFQQVRMPPATVRTIDRCQLMILACAHDLRNQLPEFWQEHAERTGVVVGHMGPTRAAMLYANRCYLDDIERCFREDTEIAATPELTGIVDRLRERVRSMTPPSNEDSFPGMMPNIISARVANYFDLKGPNITVDAGLASTLSAFATATRYLHSGELDFVLAGGINGNTLHEYRALLTEVFGDREPELAEGAFLFGLTTERTAREAGLKVLAYVDELETGAKPAADRADSVLDCGSDGSHSRYLAASGGVEVLRALQRPAAVTTEIRCRENGEDVATRLVVTTAGEPAAAPSAPAAAETVPATRVGSGVPADAQVERYVSGLRPTPAALRGPAVAAVPDGSVILTDRPGLAERLAASATGVTVFSTVAPDGARPGLHHVESTPESVRAALADVPHPLRHVTVVTDLTASAPAAGALTGDSTTVSALHDLAFLVLQQRFEELDDATASVLFLLLGAAPGGVTHPLAGLFTGLAKCVDLELADADCFALLVATDDPAEAAVLAGRERVTDRTFPIVHHDGTRRLVPALTREPAAAPGRAPAAPLHRDSVVVALGGARGITAELLTAVAERHGSRIYALGSNPIEDYPAETFRGTDEEFAATRAAYISNGLKTGGGKVADLNRSFDRMVDARAARRNLDRMSEHSGRGRVTYLTCDARDENSVRAAIDTVLAEHDRIDLVVNAPGLNRSAMIRDKDFAEFRRVRDLKVGAHRNLHRALAGRPPRMWCDFGSLLGYFGQRGESDYASGNDFLATAAGYAAATSGTDEFVIGWTLWDEVGMGANELTREYFKRAGSYSHMPVAEGIEHFLAELATPRRAPSMVHLGAPERATVEKFYPGYLDGAAPEKGRFYLRRVLDGTDADGGTVARFECPFDLDTDGYLEHHLVRGVPTLPGTFVTEIAAEAALHLVPDGVVVALEDVRFLHFLQVRRGVPQAPKKITARVGERIGDLTTVTVEITHDVVSPSGVRLVADKPHFTARVLVSTAFLTAPKWRDWDAEGERPVVDPYHVESAPVLLSGPFEVTTDTRRHADGSRSRFRPRFTEGTGPWGAFLMPTILLDALARTGVLDPVDGLVPVAAPLSIRRIDLYQQANDAELAEQHGHLDLYVVNPGFSNTGRTDNRFVAVAPGGHVVAQMKDLDATVIGYLDPATGVVHPPTAVEADRGAHGVTA